MRVSRAIFVLKPDETQGEALRRYAERYANAANWLTERVMEIRVTDQVQLHRNYYRKLRDDFGLPAQAAVLCLRHAPFRLRQPGPLQPLSPLGPVPYDRHLHSLRSVDRLSLATLDGRVILPCALAGYEQAVPTVAKGQLFCEGGDWIFAMKVELPDRALEETRTRKEAIMPDKLLSRISRVISGVAHSAISQAESSAPVAVMEQALRDIDEATKEVRGELGKSEANKFNLESRIGGLEEEHGDLKDKIALALREDEEALAEAGVSRQLDIETQVAVLKRAVGEAGEESAKLSESLIALQASRREAQERLRALKAEAKGLTGAGSPAAKRGSMAKAEETIEAAQRLGEDLTGVPAFDNGAGNRDLEALAELQRRREIRDRLAAQKSELERDD